MTNAYRFIAPFLILGTAFGVVRWRNHAAQSRIDTAPTLAAVYAPPVERVETHVLESGETLTDVLGRAAIGGPDLADLLLGVREWVNPRRLVDGVEITVRRWTRDDSPRFIELRVNADTTLRLQRAEAGWAGRLHITPVVMDTVYAQGRIEPGTTLFQALVYSDDDDVPITDRAQLVYRLASVYEFQLDFTREIQPGDAYRLVYEREARPDGTARSQRILMSEIVNQGRTFAAVWYSRGKDAEGYYDLDGRPLEFGFSRYPVNYRVTSSFSTRRYHPILGIYRAHLGTDFGAPAGTRVEATAAGTVSFAGVSGGYGNMVTIRHPNGYETRYAHLRGFARGIRSGMSVKGKQVIGYVGSTGLATGAHLHYELRKGGRAVNARTATPPPAPPLAGDAKVEFDGILGRRQALLDSETQLYLARASVRSTRMAND